MMRTSEVVVVEVEEVTKSVEKVKAVAMAGQRVVLLEHFVKGLLKGFAAVPRRQQRWYHRD